MYIGKKLEQLTVESVDTISVDNSKEERWKQLKKKK